MCKTKSNRWEEYDLYKVGDKVIGRDGKEYFCVDHRRMNDQDMSASSIWVRIALAASAGLMIGLIYWAW